MRRVRRKGGSKEKVFGCDLLEHLNASSQEVPLVLRCCSEFVETHGIVDGIYRLSGVSSNIQKLRGEFESDGSPDLNKDVFLQDIHCVSSLCKAYFRELPNPLLTYQLYDKFADAVAIQLEEERLVKIRDVLKELPQQHYRTLEFLMRHLVKMASFSSETNMHARNLAIVWAPNLLRSKDIEASGFNGTAVFKEVRVQSIVVEFILTHVPQLFPEQGVSGERRKSLPSPTAAFNQEEGLFKSGPITNIGNISPGAGPLLMRPYHAVIEGTDKRKGSLKGRKWMSIFNIGGRLNDQRRRMKNSAKEKDRPALRPARSMDSLSAASYPNEGLRRSGQRPPPTDSPTVSPLATSASQSGSDASIFSGNLGGSEYAVTYRRGTGCVGSSAGMPGTYTALDPEGSGAACNESVQSRSPGHSTKVGRRAAMHITGPTLVTVPLHITSNLALGVLQGGGGARVIHRSRDREGGDRLEVRDAEQAERRKTREIEWDVKKGPEEEEEKGRKGQGTGCADGSGDKREAAVAGGGPEEGVEEKREKEADEKEEEEEQEQEEEEEEEMVARNGEGVRKQRIASLALDTGRENNEEGTEVLDRHGDDCISRDDLQTEVTDASSLLNSTTVEGDELGLSGYVQDNFDFLDQMDCSVLDHMDVYSSYQANEFSVEPPGHSDEEYEVMNEAQVPHDGADGDFQSSAQRGPSCHAPTDEYEIMGRRPSCSPPGDGRDLKEQMKPHRLLLSTDASARHVKSLSLPYMTSPIHGPEELCSEEECQWVNSDNSDDSDYSDDSSSDRDQDICTKSLPFDFLFPPGDERQTDEQANRESDHDQDRQQLEISEGLNREFPRCGEERAEDPKQGGVEKDGEGNGGEMSTGTAGDGDKRDQQAGSEQSVEANQTEEEEDAQMNEDRDTLDGKRDKEAAAESHSDDSDFPAQNDAASSSLVVSLKLSLDTTGDLSTSGTDDALRPDAHKHESDSAVDESTREVAYEQGTINPNSSGVDEKVHQESDRLGAAKRRTSSEIWEELEDVVCEVIEEEESKQAQKQKESLSDRLWDPNVVGDEESNKPMAAVFEEAMVEVDGGQTEGEDPETTEENIPDERRDQQFEETSVKAKEPDNGVSDKTLRHHCEGLLVQGGNKEEQKGTDPGSGAFRSSVTEPKEAASVENTDSNQAGVGSKLVAFKNPKIHQVKAVPVVPPKPQHCRITALALRQQQLQQQRERGDPDRGGDTLTRGPTGLGREGPALRLEEAGRDLSRNSPLSMCFDEAVAKATMRREREKEHEKERQREWSSEAP